MSRGFLIGLILILLASLILMLPTACRKDLTETEASAVVDKIALHYGNTRVFNGVKLRNAGEKPLTYQVVEDIPWLEVANPQGELAGRGQIEITCRANRPGLSQGNYSGELELKTGTGNFTLDVYLNVEMYLVTFINPVYTTIDLRFDTLLLSPDTNRFSRKIGKNDSVQFGFFTPPDVVTYYAETFGRYSDTTQLGLVMDWEGNQPLNSQQMPRFYLDVSKAYFHLSIINNNEVLNPLYVNAGSPFETLENIFIFQSSEPLPIGYYHALNNTVIRAIVAGSPSSITWSNNGQFELPFTKNQAVVIDTYSNDTTAQKTVSIKYIPNPQTNMSRNRGHVISLTSCPE